MTVPNADIADILEETGSLLSMGKESSFRIQSYFKVARLLRNLMTPVSKFDPSTLPGVGSSMSAKIEEILKTGQLKQLNKLRRQYPVKALELTKVSGIGPKKAFKMYQESKVASLVDLAKAIEKGKYLEYKDRLQFVLNDQKRGVGGFHWKEAEQTARTVCNLLESRVKKVEVAGSFRRKKPIVRDLDIIAVSDDPKSVHEFIAAMGKVLVSGKQKTSIMFGGIQLDLLTVPEKEWGSALLYFTGSKEFNVRMRGVAKARGWTLNEHGLFSGERWLAGRTEKEIFRMLDVQLASPEKRG